MNILACPIRRVFGTTAVLCSMMAATPNSAVAQSQQYCEGRLTISNPVVRPGHQGAPNYRAYLVTVSGRNGGGRLNYTLHFAPPVGTISRVSGVPSSVAGTTTVLLAMGTPANPSELGPGDLLGRIQAHCS